MTKGVAARLFAVVLVTLSLLWPPPARAGEDLAAQVGEIVQPLFDSEMLVGLAVGVIRGDTTRVFGFGTLSKDRPVAPDGRTLFEIGGLAHPFCGLLLADMSGRGEVRLDDPVAYYLPVLVNVPRSVDAQKEISLLDLATHRSGLPRLPGNLEPRDPMDPYADYSVSQLYSFLSDYVLPREPGAAYEYSTVGMALLGQALSVKGNETLETLLVERLLDPLGMGDTRVHLSDGQRSRLAPGHSADGDPVPPWTSEIVMMAGFHSTVDDLLRFLEAYLGRSTSPLAETARRSREPQAAINRAGDVVGMGWHIQKGGVVWYNGQTGGHHSFIAFHPDLGIGVVALANSSVMAADRMGLTLLKSLAGEPVEALEFAKPVRIDPALYDRYAGIYELPQDMSLRVYRDADRLMIQPKGQAPVCLYPTSDTQFFLKVIDARVEFLVDEELNEATHLIWSQGTQEIAGKKISPEP